jgi:putative endopeptidase
MHRIDSIATSADVMAVLRELHAHGIDALFRYAGEADRTDGTRYRGEIGQGTFGTRRLHLETGPDAESHREAYRAHMRTMFERSGLAAPRAADQARAAFDLEATLVAASQSFGEQFEPANSEHPMLPGALATRAPHIDWTAYLAMVGHPPDRPLNVASLIYVKAVDDALAHRPISALRAYLRWQVLYSLAPALPARLADERARFLAIRGPRRTSSPTTRTARA